MNNKPTARSTGWLASAVLAFAALPALGADLNFDGVIDAADLQAMKPSFFSNDARADLNRDGIVDFADLALLRDAAGLPALAPFSAHAGGISVFLSPDVVEAEAFGDTFTLTVIFNGVGNPILGGGFIISFDDSVLNYVPDSFVYTLVDIAGQPCDVPTSQCIVLDPVVVGDGTIEAAAGDFTGIGLLGAPVNVAELSFEVVAAVPSTEIDMTAGGAGGPFACLFDPICTDLDLLGALVNIEQMIVPILTVSSNPLVLPLTNTDSTSTASLTVTNQSSLNQAAIGTIAVADPLAAPFAIISDGCSSTSLGAIESCEIEISFAPDADALFVDSFDIPSDAGNPVLIVDVEGTGNAVTPSISVADEISVFSLAGEPAAVDVQVTNAGTGDLIIGGVGNVDSVEAPFAVTGDSCTGATLAPSTFCLVNITFTPLTAGEFVDTFDIESNDPGSPSVSVRLVGLSELPIPKLEVVSSPDLLTRPGVAVDGDVIVRNAGLADLTIGASGGLETPFSIDNDGCAGAVLAPGAQCAITVGFAPETTGPLAGNLEIPSDDPATPVTTLDLAGRASHVGTAVPVSGTAGVCRNLTADQRLTVVGVEGVVDCEENGLTVTSGDLVAVLVRAVALSNNVVAFAGGVRTDGLLAVCTNRTTNQSVSYEPGSGTVDCSAGGLAITAGDVVLVTTRGTAY